MPDDILDSRRRSFEEQFFANQEQKLIHKLRDNLGASQPREKLREATGITDDKVLDTLVALNVADDTLAAFGLYPLVEVAWADGKVDDREREAFLKAAAEQGLTPGTPGHEALHAFLKETPREEARKAWFVWAKTLSERLDAPERKKVRENLVARARSVAESSGGFLGLGSKISEAEQRVIDRIAQAFSD